MDIQRLRNLTTGKMHTEMSHIHQDYEFITGIPGIMTHMLPRISEAVEPWLMEAVVEPRLWDGKFDPTHKGNIQLDPMTKEEQTAMLERYSKMPNPLAGKKVIAVQL